MEVKSTKRTYVKGHESRRKNSNAYKFTLITEDGEKCVHVCKKTFTDTLGISHSSVERILEKRKRTQNVSIADERSKHKSCPRRIPGVHVDQVKQKISFPCEKSHYSREQNPNVKYLNGELSVSKMYSL